MSVSSGRSICMSVSSLPTPSAYMYIIIYISIHMGVYTYVPTYQGIYTCVPIYMGVHIYTRARGYDGVYT